MEEQTCRSGGRLKVLDVNNDVGVNAWLPGAVSNALKHLVDAFIAYILEFKTLHRNFSGVTAMFPRKTTASSKLSLDEIFKKREMR